jgi:hypothetical protein
MDKVYIYQAKEGNLSLFAIEFQFFLLWSQFVESFVKQWNNNKMFDNSKFVIHVMQGVIIFQKKGGVSSS